MLPLSPSAWQRELMNSRRGSSGGWPTFTFCVKVGTARPDVTVLVLAESLSSQVSVAVTNGGWKSTNALLTLHDDNGTKSYEMQQTIRLFRVATQNWTLSGVPLPPCG